MHADTYIVCQCLLKVCFREWKSDKVLGWFWCWCFSFRVCVLILVVSVPLSGSSSLGLLAFLWMWSGSSVLLVNFEVTPMPCKKNDMSQIKTIESHLA